MSKLARLRAFFIRNPFDEDTGSTLDFLPVKRAPDAAATEAALAAARQRYGKPFAAECQVKRKEAPSTRLREINRKSKTDKARRQGRQDEARVFPLRRVKS